MIFKFVKLFLFILCTSQVTFAQSLLWEISGNDLENSSYLFGTMHVQDKRAFEFNDSVLVKIEAVEAFAPEINSAQLENFDEEAIFLKKGTIEDLVSTEDFTLIKKVVKENLGMDMSYVERFNPFILSTMIMETRSKHDMPDMVDTYLEKHAAKNGKKILSVERMENQMKYLTDIPIESVLAYFQKIDEYDAYMEQMILHYQKEDIEELLKLMYSDSSFIEVTNMLLDERNISMSNTISKTSVKQPTFFAIGAGHLAGETGVINLLRKKGYSINPIIADKTKEAPQEETTNTETWSIIAPENSGFLIEMPGVPEIESSIEETPIGDLKMNFFMLETNSEAAQNFLYGTIFMDYPEAFAEMISSKEMKVEMFDGAAKGVVEESGGKVKSQREIENNGFLGKEYQVTMMGDLAGMTLQVFMVKNRMYLIQVAYTAGKEENQEALRFLDSLKLER